MKAMQDAHSTISQPLGDHAVPDEHIGLLNISDEDEIARPVALDRFFRDDGSSVWFRDIAQDDPKLWMPGFFDKNWLLLSFC